MSTHSNPTFGFRIRFHLPPGRVFKGLRTKRILSLGLPQNERVILQRLPRPQRNRFGAREQYVIRGRGFSTLEAAERCGNKLKSALRVFALEKRIGIDLGHDRPSSQVSQMIKDAVLGKCNVQLRDDIHGLDVFKDHPATRIFKMGAVLSTRLDIDGYCEGLPTLYAQVVQLSPKQEFAVSLYNLSHFENKSEARFLLLITIVEILSNRPPRSVDARNMVSKFLAELKRSSLSDDDRDRLEKGLTNLNQESIGHACRLFVEQYSTKEDAIYFNQCHEIRSHLVHRGKTKSEEPKNPTRLDNLVSNILISLTRKGVPMKN